MKKNRTIIISLLLIAALALGIGYAATTGKLNIEGVVSTQQQTFEVKFTAYETVSSSTGVTGVPGTLPDKTVSFTVNGMSKANDTITGRFTITNENEFPMYLTGITVNNATENVFSVSTTLDNVATNPVTIAAGATTTVEVTVTLTAGMSEQIKQYFTISIDATSVNPNP